MKKIKICTLLTCLIMCFSSVTLAANFYDIKGTKYEGVVDRVAKLGIINGVSEKAFAPNKSITRAELAKMIVYTKGLQKYADTSDIKSNFKDTKGHWAEKYIATASDLELLKGYSDGTFKPDKEVSYAEVVAIILRGLGYANIDETSGTTWYAGYIKRMFEIGLDVGVDGYNSYEDPMKRGDVAMIWWNMLVSNRWVIKSETDGSGLYYTYSSKPQLEVLFPGYYAIDGTISYISDGSSGDMICVTINGRDYDTESEVPIYAVGARATAVYDTDEKVIYGLSIDEDLEDYKIVSGPIFYLEEKGYNLKRSKRESVLGSQSKANYAYLLVSKEDNEILRSVLVDGSNSYYVDSIEIKTEDDDEDESTKNYADIYINDSENPITNNNAVVIKNGKRVDWEDIEEGVILTQLIPNKLYTYESKTIDGVITDYSNLKELYIDGDKYIVSANCKYSIMGETVSKDDDSLKVFSYSQNMKKAKLEELLSRKTEFYLNAAEEISFIKFSRYRPSSIIDKYDNGNYRFFYVTSLTYSSGDDRMNVGGFSLAGKNLKYYLEPSDEIKVGDFVMITDISGKKAETIELIDSNKMYEDDDISIIYDCEDEFYNDAFGEYTLVDDTVIFRVNKYYEDNSNDEVQKYEVTKLSDIKQLENLSKYKINLLCNNDMEIDIIFAERELNKTTYPVGRVTEIKKIKTLDEDPDDDDYIPLVNVRIATVGGGSNLFQILSGDCAVGELVTYESGDNSVKIKERFQTKFLGYENDVIISSFNKDTHIATIENSSDNLNLLNEIFNFKGKEIDLMEYKYILANVTQDYETGEWRFAKTEFYSKEDLILKPGDRIAFGELNGIAVVYRGWKK